MKIQLNEIPVKQVVDEYFNDNIEGVVGYGGRLNIRPKYQREFIYKDKKRNAVLETVKKDLLLNNKTKCNDLLN